MIEVDLVMPSEQASGREEFPTLQWARRLCEAANNDSYLAEIGKEIEETIEAVIENTPTGDTVRLLFSIAEGRCTDVTKLPPDAGNRGSIIIQADYETWLKMLCGELSPTLAYFRGKLRLPKGGLRLLLRYPLLHYQLYYLASNLTTQCQSKERLGKGE